MTFLIKIFYAFILSFVGTMFLGVAFYTIVAFALLEFPTIRPEQFFILRAMFGLMFTVFLIISFLVKARA